MLGFHIPAAPPLYTNTFLLISDAGHAVVIDPAAEAHSYDEILKQHNATLTTILCTHGHYDHVGSAAALKAEWNATLYCEKADLATPPAAWCCCAASICSAAIRCLQAASAAPTLRAAAAHRWQTACASWHSCPSPVKHRCCPATANFLPLARNWTTTTISAAPCAAATTFFKERTT